MSWLRAPAYRDPNFGTEPDWLARVLADLNAPDPDPQQDGTAMTTGSPILNCCGCGATSGQVCRNISTDCRARNRVVTQAVHLPTDSAARKAQPIASGVLDYFPDALADVARLSKIGNDKHNPGQPLHWSREKSDDHADCIMRHMIDRGTIDTDDVLHDTKVAWRALAQLQLAIEKLRAEGRY